MAVAPVPGQMQLPPPQQHQPQQMQWMVAPPSQADCPPGLEYLTQIDQLFVCQQTDLLEVFTGFETNNKYAITNALRQQVYFAAEDNDCCTRQLFSAGRPFQMKILDNNQREVIHISRPLRCNSMYTPCYNQMVVVQSPPGVVIGYVKQGWSLLKPLFWIQNAAGQDVLRIDGPWLSCPLCFDVEFEVNSLSGEGQVGQICKKWGDITQELFTDSDDFGVKFPMNLDVKVKATMLAATFLIDFMFFEKGSEGSGTEII